MDFGSTEVSFWSFSTKSLLKQHEFLLTRFFRVSKNIVSGGVPVVIKSSHNYPVCESNNPPCHVGQDQQPFASCDRLLLFGGPVEGLLSCMTYNGANFFLKSKKLYCTIWFSKYRAQGNWQNYCGKLSATLKNLIDQDPFYNTLFSFTRADLAAFDKPSTIE